MRILAIDYGSSRVGLASSDPSGTLASPYKTLQNKGRPSLLAELEQCVATLMPERILVGLPIRSDGSWGPEAERALGFAHALQDRVSIPVTFLNEAFTTAEARERLKMRGGKRLSPQAERAIIDQLAATLLLEEYLTALPEAPAPLPALGAHSQNEERK